MSPDYSAQLDRLIAAVSQREVVPAWVVSLVGVILGAVLTILLSHWKERHDAATRIKAVERSLYGEMVLNHASLVGYFVARFEFNRVAQHQLPFDGVFTFDVLNSAKGAGESLFDVPNFGAIQTVFKMHRQIASVSGGGPEVRALAEDGIKHFETLLAQGHVKQALVIEMCSISAPNLAARMKSVVTGGIRPGSV